MRARRQSRRAHPGAALLLPQRGCRQPPAPKRALCWRPLPGGEAASQKQSNAATARSRYREVRESGLTTSSLCLLLLEFQGVVASRESKCCVIDHDEIILQAELTCDPARSIRCCPL